MVRGRTPFYLPHEALQSLTIGPAARAFDGVDFGEDFFKAIRAPHDGTAHSRLLGMPWVHDDSQRFCKSQRISKSEAGNKIARKVRALAHENDLAEPCSAQQAIGVSRTRLWLAPYLEAGT